MAAAGSRGGAFPYEKLKPKVWQAVAKRFEATRRRSPCRRTFERLLSVADKAVKMTSGGRRPAGAGQRRRRARGGVASGARRVPRRRAAGESCRPARAADAAEGRGRSGGGRGRCGGGRGRAAEGAAGVEADPRTDQENRGIDANADASDDDDGAERALAEFSLAEAKKLRVADLQAELKARGLRTRGKKAALAARLAEWSASD